MRSSLSGTGMDIVGVSELDGGILKSSRAETSHEKCFVLKLIIYWLFNDVFNAPL
jgi:hypothetical protein